MDIAILAATEREMQPVEKAIGERLHSLRHHGFRYLVTGVGLMHSTHTMTRAFTAHRPDLAIQVGIAGAFDTKVHAPGSTVAVHAETLGDVGASETDGTWKDLFDLGLEDSDAPPYRSKRLANPHARLLELTGLLLASGVTVNRVSADSADIDRIKAAYAPDVESMEGAALHFVCLQEGIPFVQLRGISNRVGDREKRNWRIDEAMNRLQESLANMLLRLNEKGTP